jgi:site-specific DNA-methyltransferase (adenine-specific)
VTPYFERGPVRLYLGDVRDVAPTLVDRGHVIFDPPYSEHTHKAARTGGAQSADGIVRNLDLGFAHLAPSLRRFLAAQAARLASRWVLVFSDSESSWLWRTSLVAAGLDYVRAGVWIKEAATPQFSGDRPATGVEAITICHPKGRKRWNGGGRHAVWSVPIVQHGKTTEPRLHTTQKPERLMLALVNDFTDPNEVVYDFTCGSGTTGIACLRGAGGPRRFVGIEREEKWCEAAAKRLDAELIGSTYYAARAGQGALFGTDDGRLHHSR